MLGRLYQTLVAVCPIVGVAPLLSGTTAGPGNVRIDYAPEASDAQKAAAQTALAAFDWSAPAQTAWEADRQPERKAIRQAAAQAIADNEAFLAVGSPNNAAVLAQVRALTRQMNRVISRLVQID